MYSWDPQVYARNARYVADLAGEVVELLSARSGQRVLDLGCGDGALTERLAAMGCDVTGVDSSPEMVAAPRARGLDVRLADGQRLAFFREFDAVFSNQALHWMPRADDVVAGVSRALVEGGRFVAECGGEGCIVTILAAIYEVLARRAIDGAQLNPWHFPAADEYSHRLLAHGFRVDSIALSPRTTFLPGGLRGWMETFAESFTEALPADERSRFLDEVEDALRPKLRAGDGSWSAYYVLLRFAATRQAS